MGMFDDVSLSMYCPKCGAFQLFNLQSKDLECAMYHYYPLDEDWFTNLDVGLLGRKKLRDKLSVFPIVPYDKSAKAWKSQAERSEILAKPTTELANQLKYIVAYGSCKACNVSIEGKIKIENGYLMMPLYDIEIRSE